MPYSSTQDDISDALPSNPNTSDVSSLFSSTDHSFADWPPTIITAEATIRDINTCIASGVVDEVQRIFERYLQQDASKKNQGRLVGELLTWAMSLGTPTEVLNALIKSLASIDSQGPHTKAAVCHAARFGRVDALMIFNSEKIPLKWASTSSSHLLIPLQEAINHGQLGAIMCIQNSSWRSSKAECYEYFEVLLRNPNVDTKTKAAIAKHLGLSTLTTQKANLQVQIELWYELLTKEFELNLTLKNQEKTAIDEVNALRAALSLSVTKQSGVTSFNLTLSTKESMSAVWDAYEDLGAKFIVMHAYLKDIKAQYLIVQQEKGELRVSICMLQREKRELQSQRNSVATSSQRPFVSTGADSIRVLPSLSSIFAAPRRPKVPPFAARQTASTSSPQPISTILQSSSRFAQPTEQVPAPLPSSSAQPTLVTLPPSSGFAQPPMQALTALPSFNTLSQPSARQSQKRPEREEGAHPILRYQPPTQSPRHR